MQDERTQRVSEAIVRNLEALAGMAESPQALGFWLAEAREVVELGLPLPAGDADPGRLVVRLAQQFAILKGQLDRETYEAMLDEIASGAARIWLRRRQKDSGPAAA